MRMLKKIKELTDLTAYGIAGTLENMGIKITTSGIDNYLRHPPRSMRLDVLCGLRKLSGLSWEEFGAELDSDFLPAEASTKEKKRR